MSDTATELWDALTKRKAASSDWSSDDLLALLWAHRELLAALEAWHLFYEVHLDECQWCNRHLLLCDVGSGLESKALKLMADALARECERLEALK